LAVDEHFEKLVSRERLGFAKQLSDSVNRIARYHLLLGGRGYDHHTVPVQEFQVGS
jgi:hypothetical protein